MPIGIVYKDGLSVDTGEKATAAQVACLTEKRQLASGTMNLGAAREIAELHLRKPGDRGASRNEHDIQITLMKRYRGKIGHEE